MRPIKFRALVRYFSQDVFRWEFYTTLHEPTWNDAQIAEVKIKDLQFTGLIDKNGKEIYEGDIVEVYEDCEDDDGKEFKNSITKHQVTWGGTSYPAFDLEPAISDDMNTLSYIDSTCELKIEIIGNIYSNPELLNP